jgi:hypothetical protein
MLYGDIMNAIWGYMNAIWGYMNAIWGYMNAIWGYNRRFVRILSNSY